MDTKTATDAELRAVLLTCDGKGKDVKAAALAELLNRRYPASVKDMPASAYADPDIGTAISRNLKDLL